MLKKLLIITMIAISSMHLFDVQANTSLLAKFPEKIQQNLKEPFNFHEGNFHISDVLTENKLNASDGVENVMFGDSVAIDGTTLVVGVDSGSPNSAVYVYDLTLDKDDDGFERIITPSDGEFSSSYSFGVSVAIDGTTLVVGTLDGSIDWKSGSVYVYDLTLDSEDDGFERKITASDGKEWDHFGVSVAIDGTTLVVGAQNGGQETDSGSVYVYDLTLDGNVATPSTNYIATEYDLGFEKKITASDAESGDFFGHSVALEGDILVVGNFVDDNENGDESGSVYVYNLTLNSEDDKFEQKITASDGAELDRFGKSVVIDDKTLAVGAYGDENFTGSVYMYDLDLVEGNAYKPGAPVPQEYETGFETKITASDGAQQEYFGFSLALENEKLVVSSINDDDNQKRNSGSVYIYDLTKGYNELGYRELGYQNKITASDASESDLFGISVALEGDILVVGSPYSDEVGSNSGSVYIYNIAAAEVYFMIELLTWFKNEYVRTEVEAARIAYDELTEDLQAIVINYQDLLDAEQALVDIDAAAAVDELIDALTNPLNEADVEAARDSYDNLTETQQALVTGLSDLENAESDIDAAAAVDAMIAALTSPYVRAEVDAARDAYDALTSDQQALVTIYQDLLDAEQELNNITEAVAVDTLIDGLSEPYVRAEVEAARAAYDALTETEKSYVTRLLELETAEQVFNDIDAAAAVDAMIDALNEPYAYYVEEIEAARVAYDNLTETQQALVTGLLDLTNAAVEALNDITEAAAVDALIDGLSEPFVRADVEAARDAYDNLTETQQTLVKEEMYQKLRDAEQALVDIDAAAAVDALIDALTPPYVRVEVEAARSAYDLLNETQQALVTRLLDLETAEQALVDIDAAAAVDALIDGLSEPYVRADVEAARDAYDNLTEAQQELVENYQDLLDAEQALVDIDAAAAVDAMIDALNEPYAYYVEEIETALVAYDNLTETQQALVTGLLDLTNAAVEALNDITEAAAVDALIDGLSEPFVRADVEAARDAYDNLTETQQTLVTRLLDLETAEQALVDIDAAAAVDALIDGLLEQYVRAHVEAARDAYDNLTEAQQELVENYQDLLESEQALVDIDAAAAVDALIDGLSEPYVRADVEAARDAYDNLTETQQALVTGLPTLKTYERQISLNSVFEILLIFFVFVAFTGIFIFIKFLKKHKKEPKVKQKKSK